MKKPRFATRVMGHPIFFLPALALTLFILYGWTRDGQTWPLTIAALFGMGSVMRAQDRVTEYKEWKLQWDALGETSPVQSSRWRPWFGFLLGVVGAPFLYVYANLLSPTAAIAFAPAIGCLMLAEWFLRTKRKKGPTPAERDPIVALCVTAPSLPVPSLHQAYAALPAHCRTALRHRNSQ